MRLKLALACATALTLVTAGVAYAGGNTAYTDQQGQSNVGTIWQGGGTTNSDVGSAGNPILQDGSHNTLVIDQDGTNQKVSAGVGDDFEQNGNSNDADILQQASGNDLRTVYQQATGASPASGSRNALVVRQLGANGLIGSVTQKNAWAVATPETNTVAIRQTATASSNVVEDVYQAGRNNTIDITTGGGYRNIVGNVHQGLTNNAGAESSTVNLTISGDYNGDVATTGALSINGWNGIGAGDGNDIDQAGGNTASGNHATAAFTGSANRFGFMQYGGQINTINADVLGNWNQVGIKQIDASNTSLINITGDFNDVGITQDGTSSDSGNLVTVTVSSSGNAAIANQNGGNNVMAINQ